MKKKLGLILIFVFIALYILFFSLMLIPINNDDVWNYGFAYDISLGCVPYRDFNMVITPLYPALMALLFLIFGHNILVLYIVNALFLTACLFLVLKMLGKKGLLLFIFLFAPMPIIMPSYNIFAFFLLMIIFYLEKSKDKDFIIGIMLGLLILTKQSIGAAVLIPGIFYYYKDKKKMLKRALGCFLVLVIFTIYLLVTKSFMAFLDLCVFGLFDFAGGNGLFSIYTVFTILIYVGTISFIKKHPKNIYHYYALAFYVVAMPLFDYYHFHIAFLVFLFLCLYYLPDKVKLPYTYIALFFIIVMPTIVYFRDFYNKKVIYPNDFNNYQYRLIDYNTYMIFKSLDEYLDEHPKYNFVFLDECGYFLKTINDKKIDYLDLINKGNWGYNGNKKMLDALKKEKKDTLIFINPAKLEMETQTNLDLIHYVMKNGKKVDNVLFYDVYILE